VSFFSFIEPDNGSIGREEAVQVRKITAMLD
jgi:hypothetical protein